jgi:peptide-methionine (S)-S-oxide reductase
MTSINKMQIPEPQDCLPGRATALTINNCHAVKNTPLQAPLLANQQKILFGMGCFWGAERKFWQQPGVYTTAVVYAAGYTPNPSYEEVCSGLTGHNEAVLVVYDTSITSLNKLLKVFWEAHNPTQGMRQGNDRGTQYRSGVYCFTPEQLALVEASKESYQQQLSAQQYGGITTEIRPIADYYYAEDYHQQYLHKNPGGYCGLGGLGVVYK